VISAVREGMFHIYPVTHIGEAMELLTGMPVGRRRKDGTFTKGSLFEKVDARLHELGWLAEHSFKTRKKKG
jgi:predicted ATP-dependent protease